MNRGRRRPTSGKEGAWVALAVALLVGVMLLIGVGGLVTRFGVVKGPIILAAALLVTILLILSVMVLAWTVMELVDLLIASAIRIRSYLGRPE